MPEFSTILQSSQVRNIVQQKLLERAFHDALFPRQLFRAEAAPVKWPANIGDELIQSAPGTMPVNLQPLRPGDDPTPGSYPIEQWFVQFQQYSGSIDTHMPTSIMAIVNLFLRNAHQLGMQAGQTLDRNVRDRLYNAAEAGWTVCDGAQTGVNVLRVARINGFTRARNANVSTSNKVRFDPVSVANPLKVTILGGGGAVDRYVVGFAADTAGDEYGPGTLTLATFADPPVTGAGANVTVADRAYCLSFDRSGVTFVGGGNSVDSVSTADLPTLADCRTVLADFTQNNVPMHTDNRYHCQSGPDSEAKIYSDTEFRQLMTSMPDYYVYRDFTIGQILGCVFFKNPECPIRQTVGNGSGDYQIADPIAGELVNDTGVAMHRMLFTGQGGVMEYFSDMGQLITEAGITGKTAEPNVVNNGIEVLTDRVQLIIRAPLDRLQQQVSTSWAFIGDWPLRTDAATGDDKRYKREAVLIHG